MKSKATRSCMVLSVEKRRLFACITNQEAVSALPLDQNCRFFYIKIEYIFSIHCFSTNKETTAKVLDLEAVGQAGGDMDVGLQGTHDALLSDYHNKRHTTRVPDPFSFTSVVYEFMMRAMFFGSLKMKKENTKRWYEHRYPMSVAAL